MISGEFKPECSVLIDKTYIVEYIVLTGQVLRLYQCIGESSNFFTKVQPLCIKIPKMIHSVNLISTHQEREQPKEVLYLSLA